MQKMRREIIFVAIAALLFGLAGCKTNKVADQVAEIAEKAKAKCGYVDKVGAIAKIVAVAASGVAPAGVVIVSGVEATLNAICAELAAPNVPTLLSVCPSVNGVCLK